MGNQGEKAPKSQAQPVFLPLQIPLPAPVATAFEAPTSTEHITHYTFVSLSIMFQYCLAQIVVTRSDFALYQFVSFEAITLDSENALETKVSEMVYFFYDSKETTKNKVLEILTSGIKFCSQYIPEELGIKFIGKKGTVSDISEELIYIVHPDDVKKINFDLVDEEFVCIDTEAQYLLVSGKSHSIRILPKFFIVNN